MATLPGPCWNHRKTNCHLEGKLKTLNFRLKKTGDLKDKVSVEALVTAVVKLKESIEEQKF